MQSQGYHPFRQTILSRDELRELSTLRPARAVINALVNWLVIVGAWTLVAVLPSWWTVVAAILVVGTRYYALAIIGHDGLHRRVFPDQWTNDLFNDLLIMGPIGAITRVNRLNHIEHHRITASAVDPDRHKYIHEGKEPTLPFLVFLTGLANVAPTIRNVFLGKSGAAAAVQKPASESYKLRDIAILLAWQALLIIGLSYAIGWWAYPVLWLIPVYLFTYRADLVRVFCEHSMMQADEVADESLRMVHYDSNWLELQFFAPNNMNCHVAHHLWPGIPYYNLPLAEAKVRSWDIKNGSNGQIVWRGSYCAYLVDYFFWRHSLKSLVHTGGVAC
jgi:fatty acid desaturase